jgi:NADPH:quinone reductase-like Zn-dependent oxidoreductase
MREASSIQPAPVPGRLANLFQLLESGKIKPLIARTFPFLEAAQANALL